MTMEQAPIFVSVYNRNEHFRKCIESLQKNKLAAQSHLFVAIDAPFREEDREKNRLVVEYAKSIRGFREVTLFIRKTNVGVVQNIRQAKDEIFSRYDRVIVFEDDNIFSPDFLSFVNRGLGRYEERSDIFSVSGYNYPIRMPEQYGNDVYVWMGFSAWGVGIWKEKWKKYMMTPVDVAEFLKNGSEIRKLNGIAEHYVPGLRSIQETGHITGDTLISLYQFKSRLYSVFPAVSRVCNIGHDGSGIHCGYDDRYAGQAVYAGTEEASMPEGIGPDPAVNRILWEHFRIARIDKMKIRVKRALKSMGVIKKEALAAN